jgi:peptidoglycan/xylan/chitin deacetylase (PgdA/CDA1 family)
MGARTHDHLARALAGVGCIFRMHRVVARKSDSAARHLTITAGFLDEALGFMRDAGVEFISLSALGERLASGGSFERPAVCLTFDDGYRDNLTLALPILRKHQAPATIFTPSGAPDRNMDVWFLRLENAIMARDEIRLDAPGLPPVLRTDTAGRKSRAYELVSSFVHRNIDANKSLIARLSPHGQISDEALAADFFATWDELRELADDPLVTIGCHTVSHPVLRNLSEREAFFEMTAGRDRLSAELNRPVKLFSYPYGGRAEIGRREIRLAERAGFDLAVTTYDGNIRRGGGASRFDLPRMTLGGVREDIGAVAMDVFGGRDLVANRSGFLRPAANPRSAILNERM